ncbi:hypothetical protein OsJ_25793 [Oryza sativa Japonica Group]|uniref:ATP-dependent DNA helicase n=1 Tax=Oryza sativa subsp. japonica TaxID=39947 RepID=B9FYQ5_ORYSJ|nr:hypothetical protein OsJ_25793 [Oryza sativa Japonica Group]
MDSNFGASRPTSLTGSAGDPPLGVLSDITNLSAAELRRKRARERYALLSVDEKEARNKKAREKRRQKKEECQGGNQSGAAVKDNEVVCAPSSITKDHLQSKLPQCSDKPATLTTEQKQAKVNRQRSRHQSLTKEQRLDMNARRRVARQNMPDVEIHDMNARLRSRRQSVTPGERSALLARRNALYAARRDKPCAESIALECPEGSSPSLLDPTPCLETTGDVPATSNLQAEHAADHLARSSTFEDGIIYICYRSYLQFVTFRILTFHSTIDDMDSFMDDDTDDEYYLFARLGDDEDDDMVQSDDDDTQAPTSSIPDPFDCVYSNIPQSTNVLKPEPDCKHCGAKRFQESSPEHLELYFYDDDPTLSHRFRRSPSLDQDVIRTVSDVLWNNPYSETFRSLGQADDLANYRVTLNLDHRLDQRRYNVPVTTEVAAVWVEGNERRKFEPSVTIYGNDRTRKCIQPFYGCYDPLSYPLFFPRGESGWHQGLPKDKITMEAANTRHGDDPNCNSGIRVSVRDYYCYKFQMRRGIFNPILHGGRLFQQFAVDMYIKVESSRLDYVRNNQKEIRADLYQGLMDSIQAGESRASAVGKRTVLPASFVGGGRNMKRRYMDAMALVQKYGKPDVFLTMTSNPKWDEITRELEPGQTPQDRPDLVVCVFRAKLEDLKKQLFEKHILGKVIAHVYVEFQKRGLPHAHFLLIMSSRYKLTSADQYDCIISAELPDKKKYRELYDMVVKHMMHGPCGPLNDKDLRDVLDKEDAGRSMLTAYFEANRQHVWARDILYRDFPMWFTWQTPGSTSFEDLRIVDGVVMPSFRAAAERRGLIEADNTLDECLTEAGVFQMPLSLRRLFATILVYCEPSDVRGLWDKHLDAMSDDYKRNNTCPHVVQQMVLIDIRGMLQSMGKEITSFPLPEIDESHDSTRGDPREIIEESSIGVETDDMNLSDQLNDEQRSAFNKIMNAVGSAQGGVFFVDGPGGTRKTFLYRALLATVRGKGDIAVATATSGVAASIMPGGRTAHSRFKIPLNIEEGSYCSFTKQSGTAKLLQMASLIIWDETSMTKRQAVEALNMSMRDIMGCPHSPFGGKTIVFGGDFRQVLPVIRKGTRSQITDATLRRSYLWDCMVQLKLVRNMRA